MKRNLYIVGAGGFGREIESYIDLIPKNDRDWELIGYLDSGLSAGNLEYPSDYKIIGSQIDFPFQSNDLVIIAIANNKAREKVYQYLKSRVSIFTFIAPSAIIGKFNTIGEGSIICPNVVISTNITLGNAVILNTGTQIGHDVQIGNFTSLMANIDIGGFCNIGQKVFIGTNTVIIPNRKILNDITIGAGSVVIRNHLKEGVTLFGNPAQII